VLYLRHRLQKGFLSRDQAPKDEDMANMSDHIKQLEAHEDLEAEVIKKTKVHKVLKAIMKLNSIPKEEEYHFKQRSNDLLTKWGGALAADLEPTAAVSAEPATNGAKHDEDEKAEAPKEESPVETTQEQKNDAPAEPAKPIDTDGDVAMANAGEDSSKNVPDVKADTHSSAEVAADDETATASADAATS
jgi:hypothetical protein